MITGFAMSRSKDYSPHKAPGVTPSGLLVSGLVALVIGLAALVGDIAFKNLMGNVGYIVIAILAIILIIMGITRIAKALRSKGIAK